MLNQIDEVAGKISLGNLIRGIAEYFGTLKVMVKNFRSFPTTITGDLNTEFGKAFKFATFSIILSFFIVLPMYMAYHESITKILFFVRLLTNYAFWCVLLHITLGWLGAKEIALKQTATIYSYIVGIGMPLYLLLAFPGLIAIGPTAMFGGNQEALAIADMLVRSPGLYIYLYLVQLFQGLFAWIVVLSWISKSHKIGKWRVFFAIIIASLIGSPLQLLVLNPMFNALFKLLDYWLGLVF